MKSAVAAASVAITINILKVLHYLSYFYRIWLLVSMADFKYIITFVLDVEFLEVDVVKKISKLV